MYEPAGQLVRANPHHRKKGLIDITYEYICTFLFEYTALTDRMNDLNAISNLESILPNPPVRSEMLPFLANSMIIAPERLFNWLRPPSQPQRSHHSSGF
jgi:hypothetical protein